MRLFVFLLSPTLLLLPVAAQQTPEPALAIPTPEPILQSLQQLCVDTIHTRQALAGGVGTAADMVFARVYDAEFDADGKLVTFVVDAPEAKEGAAKLRALPAKSVQWDATTNRWCLVDPNAKLAALDEFTPPVAKGSKDERPARAALLASALCAAEPSPPPPKADPDTDEAKKPPVPFRFWFCPQHRQIAVANAPRGNDHVLLPWSALRLQSKGDRVLVELNAAPDLVQLAPTTSADAPPTAATRRACYRHFAAKAPAWDEGHAKAKEASAGGEGKHKQ